MRRLRIAVVGATGFVGDAEARRPAADAHEVIGTAEAQLIVLSASSRSRAPCARTELASQPRTWSS